MQRFLLFKLYLFCVLSSLPRFFFFFFCCKFCPFSLQQSLVPLFSVSFTIHFYTVLYPIRSLLVYTNFALYSFSFSFFFYKFYIFIYLFYKQLLSFSLNFLFILFYSFLLSCFVTIFFFFLLLSTTAKTFSTIFPHFIYFFSFVCAFG